MRELNAAQRWGCPSPKFFDELEKDSRIDIVAWYEVNWRVNTINNFEAQKKAEAAAKKARKRK